MRLFDKRYEAHLRKYTLALSMVEHGARIRTVTQWTGLSNIAVQNLTQILREHDANSMQTRSIRRLSPRIFQSPLKSRGKARHLRISRSKCKRFLQEWCRMLGVLARHHARGVPDECL